MTWFALFGCSSAPPPEREAQIAPDLRFRIPSPGELGYSISAEQLVTAHYRGDVQTFEAHLSVSPQRLVLIGFDPFGRRAFTLTSGNGSTSFDAAPGLPKGLEPGNILADVAIVYWPDAAVERGLPSSAELRSRDDHRTILVDGHEVIRVDYDTPPARGWPRIAHYRNEAFGYALDLRSTVTPP
ncbi:MAG TPA: DUF3261 domain-containing protein [Stellaceae bacterium]|nr:DUF3261 domain-containing protein [Stellaceae bacterium]